MKIVYFLFLVVFCKGFPLNSAPDNVQTDKTELNKVESSDAADPVSGYRIKTIELKLNVTRIHATKIDDSQVTEPNLDLENKPQQPSVEVAAIDVSTDKNESTHDNMKERQAYTAKGVGEQNV